MSQSLIGVLIADDHQLVRQGIRQILELEPDIEVLAEASDGESAVELALQLNPDLVLMDINMPRLNGLEAARRIKATSPGIGILILSIHEDDEYLRQAAAAGVEGYTLKDVAAAELVLAVRCTGRGQPYLHPGVGARLLRETALREGPASGEHLTKREREVLGLMARGLGNRDIALELVISEKTVKNHVSHIFRKLDVTDRLHAVLQAARVGLVSIGR